MRRATLSKNSIIVCGGDFNFPDWDWNTATIKQNATYPRLHQFFIDTIADTCLEQMVNSPTRKNNILDLFLTNNPGLVPRIEVLPGISDHDAVFMELMLSVPKQHHPSRLVHVFKRADWDQLKTDTLSLSNNIVNSFSESDNTEVIWQTL